MIESQHNPASTTLREWIEMGIQYPRGKRYFLVPEDVCIFQTLLKKTEHLNVAKNKRLALLIRKRSVHSDRMLVDITILSEPYPIHRRARL